MVLSSTKPPQLSAQAIRALTCISEGCTVEWNPDGFYSPFCSDEQHLYRQHLHTLWLKPFRALVNRGFVEAAGPSVSRPYLLTWRITDTGRAALGNAKDG